MKPRPVYYNGRIVVISPKNETSPGGVWKLLSLPLNLVFEICQWLIAAFLPYMVIAIGDRVSVSWSEEEGEKTPETSEGDTDPEKENPPVSDYNQQWSTNLPHLREMCPHQKIPRTSPQPPSSLDLLKASRVRARRRVHWSPRPPEMMTQIYRERPVLPGFASADQPSGSSLGPDQERVTSPQAEDEEWPIYPNPPPGFRVH